MFARQANCVYTVNMWSRVAALVGCLTCAGCHLSDDRTHSGSDATTPDDPGTDACAEEKFRTSGMAEEFGIGARCEFLVVCADEPISGSLEEAIVVRFPTMTCSFHPDYSCDRAAVSSCIAYVGTLSAEQYDSGCELSLMGVVTSIVCAGDL